MNSIGKKKLKLKYNLCSWLVAIVFCMQFVVSFLIKRLWGVLSLGAPHDVFYIVFTQLFAVALPCVVLVVAKKADYKYAFSLRPLGPSKGWCCFFLGMALQPIAMLLNTPLRNVIILLGGEVQTVVSKPPQSVLEIFLLLGVVCVVPALFEEFLLRGLLLGSVKKYGISVAIIVTSLMFVFLHQDFSSTIGLFLLGVALAYSVLMTGSVWAGVVTHFSFNATGVVIDYFVNKYYQLNNIGFFVLLSVLCLVVVTVMVFKLYNKKLAEFMAENKIFKPMISFLNIPAVVVIAGYFLGGLR